jgi:iduronate 2-sulfatase
MSQSTKTRKPIKEFTLIVWFIFGALVGGAALSAGAAEKLNVLFVMADDLRDFGGAFTKDMVKTPNLDRLAARGVRFERAFAQYPVCNPSRVSMLTGLRPEETRVVGNTTMFRSSLPEIVTLPQLLRQQGWFAGSYGKIFHVGEVSGEVRAGWTDEGKSWDEAKMFQATALGRKGNMRELAPGKLKWCKVGAMDGTDDDQPDGQNAVAAIAAIEKQTAAHKPWFIGAGFHKPHDPFLAPRKYFALYPTNSLTLYHDPTNLSPVSPLALPKGMAEVFAGFSDAERRDFLRAYLAGVSFMDAQVGRLLETLDRLKLWDNTVVIFLGDHGYHTGERDWWNKNTLFDRSCRAPLIIAAPGVKGGQICRSTVEFLDLYPTVAEFCGVTPPHKLSGRSLRAVLGDVARPHKDAAFTLVTRGPQTFGRSVRTERWRFTQWSDGQTELYDHSTDAEETRNVSSDSASSPVLTEMKKRLDALPPWPAEKR